ncbi:C39 family peptidase [Paenibacillus andongensis]|uniref:C39 family peptidase n=1 Tax=Paenibacillus andongensis TaxID=2975482 RepID=UPI0021BB1DA3|nr:C39 family peptidase [Paenibacillus andongensis]
MTSVGPETKVSTSDKPNTFKIHNDISESHFDKEHHIDVPVMSQYPEYVNGCEITSLAMLSTYLKLPYDRQDLINMLAKDVTPRQGGQDGSIDVWGDPNQGFVGDITGSDMGYGVYHKPIRDLLAHIYNDHALDMTGNEFSEVEKQVALDHPVIIWTTSNFTPSNEWVEWKAKDGSTIHATFEEHAVLLVGYDEENVYVNNPLNGKKAEKIAKQPFIESWKQLGKQAVTYVP